MKVPANKRDNAVSEVVGMLLIFSITASTVSGLVIWYIPATGQQYENQFVSAEQQALSSFANQLSSNGLTNGSTVSQSIPMGVQGLFFTNPEQSSLSYSGNFNISVHYDVSVGISYSGNTPPGQINNRVIKNLTVGQNPDGVAVDTVNNLIFILDSNYSNLQLGPSPGNVIVVSGATNLPVKEIPLAGFPTGITFDTENNLIFITEGNVSAVTCAYTGSFSNGGIQVISGNSLSIIKTLNFSSTPFDIAYIPYLNEVMFTISYPTNPYFYSIGGGGAVVALNVSTYAESGYIQLAPPNSGTIPSGIAYDPANGFVYVALGSDIAVVNPLIDKNVSGINIESPWSVAFDTSNGYIFSTASFVSGYTPTDYGGSYGYTSPRLLVINGSNNAIAGEYGGGYTSTSPALIAPTAIVFDSANHLLYMTDYATSKVWIIDGRTGEPISTISGYPSGSGPGNGPNAIAYDPLNGEIYVPNWLTNSVTIISGDTVISSSSSGYGENFSPTGNYTGDGQISSFASTSFIPQRAIDIQDGFVVQAFSGNSFGQSISGTPLSVSHKQGLVSASFRVMNLEGNYFSISQTGNYILEGIIQNKIIQGIQSGELLSFQSGGVEYTANVTNILMNNFTMTIYSPSIALWNYTFYRDYVNATSGFNSNPNGTFWTFNGLPLNVRVFKNSMVISTVSASKEVTPLLLEAFNFEFLSMLVN